MKQSRHSAMTHCDACDETRQSFVAVHYASRDMMQFRDQDRHLSPGKSAYAVHRGDACSKNGLATLEKTAPAHLRVGMPVLP